MDMHLLNVDRMEAEKLLKGKKVGTYLLRKGDQITYGISFHLEKENRESIQTFVLTFVDFEEKISELVILHVKKGWTILFDDPDLSQPCYHFYPTLETLLESLRDLARHRLVS